MPDPSANDLCAALAALIRRARKTGRTMAHGLDLRTVLREATRRLREHGRRAQETEDRDAD